LIPAQIDDRGIIGKYICYLKISVNLISMPGMISSPVNNWADSQ